MADTITVQPGQTLYGIYGPNWKAASGYTGDPTKLPVGTVLPSPGQNSSPVPMSKPAPNMSTRSGPAYAPPATPMQANNPAFNRPNIQSTYANPELNSIFNPNAAKPLSNPNFPGNTGSANNPQMNPLGWATQQLQNIGNTIVPPVFAQDVSSSASLKTPTVPDSVNPERTGEVSPDTVDRTHVVKGTPTWVVPILQQVARKYNIPTAILSALAKHESNQTFDPTIRQIGGGLGRGMFQLDIGQHPDVTEAEAFDPKFSADYAAKLLREGFDRTGSWSGALRYYNGGPNFNSNRPGYNGVPVSQLTQNYANIVNGYAQNTIPVQDPNGQKQIMKQLGR